MSLSGQLRYHVHVDLLGRAFLRYQRLRSERKQRRRAWWKHEHLAPPLSISPRLKESISLHYLKGQHLGGVGKVAWVTSGAPVEFLKTLGFHLHYPENHGAVCGVRRMAVALCEEAENAGYSRDLCSYARTDFGMVLSGRTPVGKVPPPDLLVCCTNICQTVLGWYRVLAEHYRVPLVLIDTPFLFHEDDAPEHAVDFVKKQLEEGLEVMERVAGHPIDDAKLHRVMLLSRDATELWAEVMARGRAHPAPITAFDEFFHMSPIVQMRGEESTVDYYHQLLRELDARIARGEGALFEERKRVLWDNLPIWYRVRELSELLAARGVTVVASTYTNAWGELAPMMDANRPLDSMARVYMHPILNRGTGHKLKTMKQMVEDYAADGVLLHSDRSCKPYSIGQMDQTNRLAKELGVPALLLEADHNDERNYAEQQATNRLEAFFEMLEAAG